MCVLNELSISKALEVRQDIKKLYLIPFAVSACGWQFIADALAVGADGRV